MHITVYTTWIDIWPVTVLPHCMLEISIGGKTNPAASAPAQKKKKHAKLATFPITGGASINSCCVRRHGLLNLSRFA
jgi:hypothetical protein